MSDNKPEFRLLENTSFLMSGSLSIFYSFGIFFCFLAAGVILFALLGDGFSIISIKKLYFILGTYFLVSIGSVLIVVWLRINAVSKLSVKNKDQYIKFLNSDNNEKHRLLGSLLSV